MMRPLTCQVNNLVNDLHNAGRLDLLESTLRVPALQTLVRAQRRQLFDVELTFSNLSIVIETKVDSDEGGRWDGSGYQTVRIATKAKELSYLNDVKYYRFLTYGTSEFYLKPIKPGPASSDFIHIKLEDMIRLLKGALTLSLPGHATYDKWHSAMKIERLKRANAATLLKPFAEFRSKYLEISDDVDFPMYRVMFCAPELAFPLMFKLAEHWNSTKAYRNRFGLVTLYPINRMSPPVHDSVLNFWDIMYKTSEGFSVGKKHVENIGNLYFEINEDFNLNLKLDADDLPHAICSNLHRLLEQINWQHGIKGRSRYYKQGVHVLFEWDFGFLNEPDNPAGLCKKLFYILDTASVALR